MSTIFCENLAYAIHGKFGAHYRDKMLADALAVDRSTVSRMRNGAIPGLARLETLSRFFGVAPSSWALPPEDFVAAYKAVHSKCSEAVGPQASVSMSATEAYRHLWPSSLARHKGDYIAYWKAFEQEGQYVASLLTLGPLGAGGITFSMINPYVRDDMDQDSIRIWRYGGVVYPVADYLYFFGEQADNHFELFSMIMTASPITPPDLMRGCLCGIHVMDGQKQIAVNVAVVLAFVKRPITGWQQEIGGRLGKLPAGKVPPRIRKLIDPFPGVIPVP